MFGSFELQNYKTNNDILLLMYSIDSMKLLSLYSYYYHCIAGAYAAAGAAMATPLLAQAQLVILLLNSPGYSLC